MKYKLFCIHYNVIFTTYKISVKNHRTAGQFTHRSKEKNLFANHFETSSGSLGHFMYYRFVCLLQRTIF